ncbi:hypothetical protein GRI39_07960 [Altererythrobacter indicus]|uniref:DUF4129 domain-containing protein n=1 Tax=Altericroceibacterium indicum TaxID=374177 RepID=A0A845AB01_9SPHN|nr:hypothetical protein [Altericroceibacterium indicum]MXP25975.1 hypothetical protein [Altericroceibacterium indicum]
MTDTSIQNNTARAADDFARHWQAVRHDEAIQFSPIKMSGAPQTPDWLARLFRALGELLKPLAEALGVSWPTLKWALLALLAAAVLYSLWRLLSPFILDRPLKAEQEDGWAPDTAQATALLEDADRLADEGRYGEATHLLLQRSVNQIRDAKPDLLEPSSTAREIAHLKALPDKAREAFSVISERVERSMFALRPLNQDDWLTARAAYSEFALTGSSTLLEGRPA